MPQKVVRADGYAPPPPVCKTGTLLLRQARMGPDGPVESPRSNVECLNLRPSTLNLRLETGASDRVGYPHDPLYKSGAIVRHAGI